MKWGAMRSRGLCFAIVLLTAGCRQIIGFDGQNEADDGSEKADPEALPLLPFVPDPEFLDGCKSCAQAECSAERKACVADPTCKELLRCRGACSDPVCIARCGSYNRLDFARWTGNSGRVAEESTRFFDYYDCLASVRCTGECGWGSNWACLGNKSYRWPTRLDATTQDQLHVHFQFIDFLGAGGGPSALVTPCSALGICSLAAVGTANRAEISGWGQVELSFDSVFDGYLEIETNKDEAFRELRYPGPLFRETYDTAYVFPAAIQPPYPQAGFASVQIILTDCLVAPASGIRLELLGALGMAWSSGKDWEVSWGTPTSQLGIGGVWNVSVPDRAISVVAKRADEIVARKTISLRRDWLTTAFLYPRTEDD